MNGPKVETDSVMLSQQTLVARDSNDVNINIEMKCQVRNKHSFSAVRHRTLAAAVQECVHKWVALCTVAARNKTLSLSALGMMHLGPNPAALADAQSICSC